MNNQSTKFLILIVLISTLIINAPSLAQVGWSPLTSGTFENLTSIQFTDANTGYAAGNGGVVLKTTNSGLNWTLIQIASAINNTSISVVNANTVYIGLDNGRVLLTSNGGVNWFTSFVSNSPLSSVYFTSASKGFACGNDQFIYGTTNSCQSWDLFHFIGHSAGINMKCFFINSAQGWVLDNYSTSGNTKLIYYTNNGGVNWNNPYTINSIDAFNSIHFISTTVGYVAGNNGKIFKTENAGVNWSSQTSNITQNLKSIISTDLSKVYTVGEQGKILYSSNGGNTWLSQTSNTSNNLNCVYFAPNSSTGWVCGNSGTILKTTTGGVGIRNLNSELPNSFKLYQNYPNPFNPETNIRFDLIKNSNVKLTVFDISGKELYTLIDQHLSIGSYEYKFDGSKLSSGIYFYKIKTDNFESVEKMILNK